MLSQTCNVHIEGLTRRPFRYRATFVWSAPDGHPTPPLPAYLYADGDLAAFLEDCGAELKEIAAVLDNLKSAPDADIAVASADDLIEVFAARQA